MSMRKGLKTVAVAMAAVLVVAAAFAAPPTVTSEGDEEIIFGFRIPINAEFIVEEALDFTDNDNIKTLFGKSDQNIGTIQVTEITYPGWDIEITTNNNGQLVNEETSLALKDGAENPVTLNLTIKIPNGALNGFSSGATQTITLSGSKTTPISLGNIFNPQSGTYFRQIIDKGDGEDPQFLMTGGFDAVGSTYGANAIDGIMGVGNLPGYYTETLTFTLYSGYNDI